MFTIATTKNQSKYSVAAMVADCFVGRQHFHGFSSCGVLSAWEQWVLIILWTGKPHL